MPINYLMEVIFKFRILFDELFIYRKVENWLEELKYKLGAVIFLLTYFWFFFLIM